MILKEDLKMPAKSKAQQRFFGMVRAAQKGEMDNPSSEVLDAADSISVKDAKKFAKTKHKGLPEKKEVSEARANAVIARRILQNKKKCADCGSYAHVTGASNCPSKKDPEGLPEGASILKARGKRNTYRGPTGDHRRDKEGNIEADFYKKKPAPTGEKWGDKSGRPKKPSPLAVRARRKKRKEEKAAKAAGSVVQTKSGKKVNSNYEKLKAKIYAKDDARKKKAQEYSKKTNPNYGKSHGGRKYEYTSVKEGKLDNVMNIVRKYGKKKPEKKAEKAMDAGARAKRLLQRKQHAKYVSGSTENVPDDIRDHYTHI